MFDYWLILCVVMC